MKPTTFAYVCAPDRMEEVFESINLKEYCRILFRMGYVPVCPNLMFREFLLDTVPEQREARKAMCLSVLRRCRVLVVCGNKIDAEMETAILLAKRLGIVATTLDGLRQISLYGQRRPEAGSSPVPAGTDG